MTTQTAPITPNDTDGILTAFAQDYEAGVANVADWSKRFPDLGRDFARVAAQAFAGSDAAPEPDERLQRVALNALRLHKAAYLSAAPLVSLIDKERGITAAALAAAIGLPLPFVAKLNQRLFHAATIPQALVTRLADATRRSVDDVNAFLLAPPTLARGAAYRADDAPVVGQAADFADALRADASVSPEARALYGGK